MIYPFSITENFKEFAKKTGASEYTIRRWIKESKIIAERIKDGLRYRYLIDESELKKVIKGE